MYLITPTLGLIKNYIKYKRINPSIFIRTPFIYLLLNFSFHNLSPYQLLIYERWFFFLYKISLSYVNDDYHVKKDKYQKKYNLKY